MYPHLILMSHAQREENSEISCTMNNADHLNRLRLPDVGHDIRVKVPKAIPPVQEFFVVMPNARGSAQQLKSFVKFTPQTLGGIRAVLGDVEKYLLQVVLGFLDKNEKPLYRFRAFARRRSSIISRSSSKTSSPSINSPRSAWPAPLSSLSLRWNKASSRSCSRRSRSRSASRTTSLVVW